MADEQLILLMLLLCVIRRRRRKRAQRRRANPRNMWIRDIFRRRKSQGDYHNLVRELRLGDREYYFKYMRMSPESFENLLTMVGPRIAKKSTRMREAISAAERLTATIHYLAYGGSQQSVSFAFRIGKATVSKIVRETCIAIWEGLKEKYLRSPRSPNDWRRIAEEFHNLWNFPHCVGAIDGKHINVQCPLNSGSLYHNYKGFFSIVLMAICDAKYVFTLVDIGNYGSTNDSAVLNNSSLGESFQNGRMHLPASEPLHNSPVQSPLPYFLVGDEAFALKTWLQRPYPGQGIPEDRCIFNYRLSRARRVIENSFGILAARWRIFHLPIQTSVETAVHITQAAVCLHNYLRQTNSAGYCPAGFVDSEDKTGAIRPGEWRSIIAQDGGGGAIRPLPNARGSRYAKSAVEVREALKQHFNSDQGSLPWQWDHVRSRGPRR